MESKIIVLSVDFWNLTLDDGSVKSGVTMWYYPAASLDKVSNSDSSFGIKPCKSIMDQSFLQKVKDVGGVPAVGTASFQLGVSSGKQVLNVVDVDFSKK